MQREHEAAIGVVPREVTMGIDTRCGRCGKQYVVPDNWAGKKAKCPKCSASVEVPMPAIDVVPIDDAAGNPFANDPFPSDPLFGPTTGNALHPGRQLPSTRPNAPYLAGARPATGIIQTLARSDVILVCMGIGMGLLALQLLWQLASRGFAYASIPAAVLLAIGIVIMIGHGEMKIRRRNRSKDKNRAIRMLTWFFGGLFGIAAAFAGMVLFGRMGYYLPSVVQIGAPFMFVSGLVALISALILGYYILVLLFPNAPVLRAVAWGYVGLTVLLPTAFMAVAIVGTVTRGAVDRIAKRPDESQAAAPEETPFFSPPVITPKAPLVIPRADRSPGPSRNNAAPGEHDEEPERRDSFLPPDSLGSPSARPFGQRGIPGLPRRPPNLPGPGFRGPPTGPTGSSFSRGFSPPTPPDFESLRRKIVAELGETAVVTIVVNNVPSDKFSEITQSIQIAANAERKHHAAVMTGGVLRVVIGPVGDIEMLAAKLSVGAVTEVDAARRTITIDADTSK